MSSPDRHRVRRLLALVAVSGAAAGLVAAFANGTPASAARVPVACSGSSTDASTIQSAINGSANGDEIVISGSCTINATIRLVGNRSYRGDSPYTTLTASPGSNLAAVLASDSWTDNTSTTGAPITLRDLTVNANTAANPSSGDAVVIRSWNTTVSAIHIENARMNGLRVTNTSRNGTTLTNTQVNGDIHNLFVENSGGTGIYVQDSGNAVTDWSLTDSRVASSGADAIKLDNAAGWIIERNHVYGVGGTGINADSLFATSLNDNYVEDFATNGIGVSVQGDAGSTIADNRIFQFGGSGSTFLAVKQVNYGTGQLAVTGNMIRGSGTGIGLSYQRGSNQLTVTTSGNAVTDVTTQRSTGAGVTVTGGV
jgi:hypothetical protein